MKRSVDSVARKLCHPLETQKVGGGGVNFIRYRAICFRFGVMEGEGIPHIKDSEGL